MYIQVYEDARVVSFPAIANSATFPATPFLRPRLQGYRGSMQGAAFDAKLADHARVLFSFAPFGGAQAVNLRDFSLKISVEQAPVLGLTVQEDFPANVYDVSGAFYTNGRISTNVSLYGVNRISYTLTHIPGTAITGALFFQVLAAERGLDAQNAFIDEGQT